MGCPEESLEEKLIRHPGIVVLRQAGASVEVCLPEGFIMRYRLYAPEETSYPYQKRQRALRQEVFPKERKQTRTHRTWAQSPTDKGGMMDSH